MARAAPAGQAGSGTCAGSWQGWPLHRLEGGCSSGRSPCSSLSLTSRTPAQREERRGESGRHGASAGSQAGFVPPDAAHRHSPPASAPASVPLLQAGLHLACLRGGAAAWRGVRSRRGIARGRRAPRAHRGSPCGTLHSRHSISSAWTAQHSMGTAQHGTASAQNIRGLHASQPSTPACPPMHACTHTHTHTNTHASTCVRAPATRAQRGW